MVSLITTFDLLTKGESNMDNRKINQQIAIYMTNKKLCEFNDKLKAAPVEYYAHMHAQGEKVSGSARQRSCIGMVLQDYSNGTGNSTIRVFANLAPEFFSYALSRVAQGTELFDYYEEKIFGTPNEQGYSSVTKASIKRASYGQDGQPRKYPWCIQVENGKAIKEETSTGGIHMKKGTYKKERSVFVNISDYDFYRLMLQTSRYINAWELTVAPKRIREAQQLLEQENKSRG